MDNLFQFLGLQHFAEGGDGNGDPNAGDNGGNAGDKSFTQADLDRIVAERLAREKAKFGDYEDLKRKAAEFDKGQQAQLSEQEKLKAELEAEKAKGSKATEAANQRMMKAELKLQAAAQGVPADRIAAVMKLADTAALKVGDDGEVVGAEEAIKACLKANPFLLAGIQGGANLGGNPGAGGKAGDVNPWKKETFNLTKQAQILRENPALAAQLKAAAK